MIKRAPHNVRYLGQFGEHILTQSFTALDPGRVKTCASQESVEPFSLLPSSDAVASTFGFRIDQTEKNFLRAN